MATVQNNGIADAARLSVAPMMDCRNGMKSDWKSFR
jgi:hypothetical protein